MATEGEPRERTIRVKLVVDTSEYAATLRRVAEALDPRRARSMPIRFRASNGAVIDSAADGRLFFGNYLTLSADEVTALREYFKEEAA